MNLRLVTPPDGELIPLNEVKTHLRVDSALTADDGLIQSLVTAAMQTAEHRTGRSLLPQTWELALDRFPEKIALDKPPIIEVESVKYVDANGDLQILPESDYLLDDFGEPGRLIPAYSKSWPMTREQPNAVRIRFRAGYENAAAVPQAIKQWILLTVGTMYENREGVVVGQSVQSLPHIDGLLDRATVWR
ncbi:MAG TPA: head-tail connector protein [Noviherbaspirillum sp.]|nr:head-tail connector protein [Noviherbaspirillum sp.]